ncbi:MAG: TetR/AcrR family transcriptional regulator [Christensenella sp.]|nr:TetR/AcrR family transcriptional regulator [Christensenella sp.]
MEYRFALQTMPSFLSHALLTLSGGRDTINPEVIMFDIDATENNENRFYKDTFIKTSADRRKKLWDVAIDEFSAKGYSATNINDIARKAGVSIGAMYSYFASKEDLFLTIVEQGYLLLEMILKNMAEESEDIFDFCRRALIASREYALKYPKLNQIYLDLTTQSLSSMSVRLSNKMEAVTTQHYRNFFAQAKEKGLVRADLDERAMSFLLDSICVMYQFSFSSEYYKERMKLFLGDEEYNDIETVESHLQAYIHTMIAKS